MKIQPEINYKMRACLIDWLIEICEKLKFCSETLFMGINIIDRFLSKTQIKIVELQLVGCTAILISSKFYETYIPRLNSLVKIANNSFTKSNICDMEMKILLTLDYCLFTETSFDFVAYFFEYGINELLEKQEIGDYLTKYIKSMVKYCAYLQLLDANYLNFLPSELAATAIYIGFKKVNLIIDDFMVKLTEYKEAKLQKCIEFTENLVYKKLPVENSKAIYNKFCTMEFCEISKISPSS